MTIFSLKEANLRVDMNDLIKSLRQAWNRMGKITYISLHQGKDLKESRTPAPKISGSPSPLSPGGRTVRCLLFASSLEFQRCCWKKREVVSKLFCGLNNVLRVCWHAIRYLDPIDVDRCLKIMAENGIQGKPHRQRCVQKCNYTGNSINYLG